MSVVTPSGAGPVSGNVQSCVTVDATVQSYNGVPYVPRHYSLEPAANAATPLPLTLTAFTGGETPGGNQLRRTSAMEENTAWFGIEKQSNSDFVDIGRVAAVGNMRTVDLPTAGPLRCPAIQPDSRSGYSPTLPASRSH